MKDQTQRFAYIDALRGFAILAVLMGHAANVTRLAGPMRTFADGGLMGVQLFFVISAFTIFHMLSRHVRDEQKPIRNFFIRRLFRIAPVYWFGIIFYMIIWGMHPQNMWWHYPVNVLLLNALHPETQSLTVPGGWTISMEMLFYLTVPFWFSRIRNLTQARTFMLVCVFILPLVTYALKKLTAPWFAGIEPYWVNTFWYRFPLISLGSFSFGILLFYMLKDERILAFVRRKSTAVISTVLICATFGLLSFLLVGYPVKPHFYCLLSMLLALVLSQNSFKFFVNPLTVFIGRISYSLYLVHFAVLTWIIKWLPVQWPHLYEDRPLYFGLVLVIGTLVSVPLAYLSFSFIEKPAIDLARRIIVRLESGRGIG
jgi:peptidoglycan/LPS O-acetylase OafA/YrhL